MKVDKIRQITQKFTALLLLCLSLTGCSEEKNNIELGMTAIQELRYDDAIEIFSSEFEKTNDEALAYRGQGLAHMGLSNYEEAIVSFKQALNSETGQASTLDYDINYYLATAMYRTGDLNGAIGRYNAIIDLKEDDIKAYYLRGTVKLAADLYDSAIVDFDKVIQLAPKDYQMLIDIYTSLADNDYVEKGKSYLQTAIDQADDKMKNHEKGMIYYYLEEYTSAKDFLELGKADGGEVAVLMLGKSYEALKEYNSAITVYKTYLETNVNSVVIYNQLALSEMELSNYGEALIAIEQAMAIENNQMMQTLKYNEIVIYEYLKDYKKATVLMEYYLSLYPDDVVAIREYEFLKTR